MLAPKALIDRYELVCLVGQGAIAQVWAARDRGGDAGQDGRTVALKVFNQEVAEDPTFKWTLVEEGRLLTSFGHRNVARVLDVGEAASRLYVASEYVDGDSLASLLLRAMTSPIPIPLGVALRVCADAAAALHAAHTLVDGRGQPRPIVHREISPQSLVLGEDGRLKIVDFGIAIARERASVRAGAELANARVRYLAPEQVRRDPVAPATDVFGVGAVLFRMMAGRAPYEAAHDSETTQALLASAPPLQKLPDEVPDPVRNAVLRAIAPKMSDRFASARELALALEHLLAQQPPSDVGQWVTGYLTESLHERRRALGAPAPKTRTAPLPVMNRAAPGPATEPGFMDVGALVAQARTGSSPDVTPNEAPPSGRRAEGPSAATAQRGPSSARGGARTPEPAVRSRSRKPIVLGVLGALVVVALGSAWLMLPSVAKTRAISTAREAGIDLKIDDASVEPSGITLRGLKAKAIRAPGISATAKEVRVSSLFGLHDLRVDGLDASLVGERADLEIGLGMLLADSRRSPSKLRHVSLLGARASVETPAHDKVLAGDVGAEVDVSGAPSDEMHATVGRFEITTGGATFGPWSSSFDGTPTMKRARVAFDPPVPDGPSLLLVWPKNGPLEITLKVARSPFKNVGVHPADLGLPAGDDNDVEATVTGTIAEAAPSELSFSLGAWGLRPEGFRSALDVRIEGSAKAAPGKPFELVKTTVTAGPFGAGVTGTVTPSAGGVLVDALFKTSPVPCERLARGEAKSAGPLAATLLALGQTTGALKVTGTLNASGTVHFDTTDPKSASLTWLAKETCGVSIFGM